MPFLTGGYPSLEVTTDAIGAVAAAGASIIEVGIPFRDPIADGPVIAASMHEALASGATVEGVFRAVRAARAKSSVGLIAMVSASIVTKIGEREFVAAASDAGFDGLIVPDLDFACVGGLAQLCDERSMSLSLLVAPTSSPQRIAELASACRGFIYLLARAGLTGEREAPPEVAASVRAIRAVSALPIAGGFGISTPAHVAAVTEYADAAIVGSALIRRMGSTRPVEAAAEFTQLLATGLRTGAPTV